MRMLKVAAMLIACTEGARLEISSKSDDIDDKESKLSQSVATAFQMEPPKLMNQGSLPEASKNGACPKPGK